MGFDVIAKQIAMLAVIMLLGFIGVKTKYLNADLKDSVSKLVLRITLPLLNLTAITGQTLRPDMLKNAGIVIVVELCFVALLFGIGLLGAKLFRLPPATRAIHSCMSAFGNVIFLGYPLITALYGQEGLFYAIVYALVNDGIVWTVGLLFIAGTGEGKAHAGLSKLLNPNTIAFAVSLIMLLFGLRLPPILHETLASVGSMTTCLSMLFIGMTLATIPLQGIYKRWSVYVIVLFKMILIPMLLTLLLSRFPLDTVLLGVLLLEAAMPGQTVLTIIANEFGADYQYAAERVFITTVFSLITLPGLYWFMLHFI